MAKRVLVQIRLPEKLVKTIDKLIKEGYYSSRSELYADALRRFLNDFKFMDEISDFIEEYLSNNIKRDIDSRTTLNIDINKYTTKNIHSFICFVKYICIIL